jgi:hypothetical protein
LRRSAAHGGSWKARTVGGEVAGFIVLNPRTGRVLSDTNLVATIDAGDVGCPALSP